MALTKEQKQEAIRHAQEVCADEEFLRDMLFDYSSGVETACEEGCVVEPDGRCPHGYPSPLRIMGYI